MTETKKQKKPPTGTPPLSCVNVTNLVNSWHHKESTYLKEFVLLIFVKSHIAPSDQEEKLSSQEIYEAYTHWLLTSSLAPEVSFSRGRGFTLNVERILLQSGVTYRISRARGERYYFGLTLQSKDKP